MELKDLRSLSYAVVDVETTGTSHKHDRIMEIAVVHVDGGAATTAAELLVNPQRAIHPWVTRLTGIDWDAVHEAPTFADIAPHIWDALDGRVFVAHNVNFDWRFVSGELKRSLSRRLRCRRLCTVQFAGALLSYLRRRNLDALAWHYEVPIVGRHRAGGDARATARVLQRLLSDARRMDVDTWADLQAILRMPKPKRGWSYLPRPVTDEAIA